MTRDENIIRNKVGVLELAKQLGSVSQACRIMGFSRDSFYRFKDLYRKGGEAALIEMSRRVPNPKNRVAEAVERRILELALDQPAWGYTRMANELAKEGVWVSPTGVPGVWVRHDLNTMAKRVTLIKPVRVGFTTLLSVAVGHYAVNDPAPILILQPTEADCRDYMVSDLEPLFAATPALAGVLADDADGQRNTMLSRRFAGGSLKVVAHPRAA